jgi:signal transduction histidine kinase/DNA-binding response OmpR family regulator
VDDALNRLAKPAAHGSPRAFAAWIVVVFTVVVAVLGGTVVLATRSAGTIDELRGLAVEAANQAAHADSVLDALSDAESTKRGLLLNRQPHTVARYRDALDHLEAAQADLERLASNTPWLRDDAAALRVVVQDRIRTMNRETEPAETRDQTTVQAVPNVDDADIAMTAAHPIVARIIAHADTIHEDRLAMIRAREHQTAMAVVAVSVFGLLMLGIAAVVLVAGHARLARSDSALRLQSARLRATIANLRDGVAVFDAQDQLLLWNDNFFAASGLPRALATAGCAFSRFSDAAAAWPGAPLALARPRNAPRAAQVDIEGRTIDLWRAAMPDGGQLIAVTDATERVAVEANARQASKMEALGQLTGGVAHDFNNLLQVVSSNLEMLRQALREAAVASGGMDDRADRKLSAAMAGVGRAAQLTRRLLAFARRQPLAPATIEPLVMLNGLQEMLGRTLGETIAVIVRAAPDTWPVHADPHLLENAILNLALNARDAMAKGGRLTIAAENFVSTTPAHGVAAGEYVRVTVADTGHGMSPQTLARAVEPFFTTKPDGHGTGLGLPMVFGFARQSGGNLELASVRGEGTTATLLLPRSRHPVRPLAVSAAADVADTRRATETVLAVEDDDAVRSAAVDALESLGYRVVAASNAGAALNMLLTGLRPDILFTDVVMPGELSAWELAEQARRLVPGIAVLFTSGYTDKEASHRTGGEHQPATRPALLGKPWRIGELDRRLRAALAAARTAAPAGPDASDPVVSPHGDPRARRALLVEDDAMVRMVTADLLTELGYQVSEHSTGAEALAALRDIDPDLLMTDIGLPDMDGIEVAREAVRIAPDLAVIIASGAIASGTDGFTFLEKPYDAARLRHAVGRALQGAL